MLRFGLNIPTYVISLPTVQCPKLKCIKLIFFFNILSQCLKLLSVSVFLVSVQHHLTKMKLICYFLIGIYHVYSFWFYIWFTRKNPTHMYDQTACALCLARGKSSWVLSCCLQAQKSNLRSERCMNRILDSR